MLELFKKKAFKLDINSVFNLLAPELFFLILAHPVYKMWIKQEPNMLELFLKKAFKFDINSVFNLLAPEIYYFFKL